MVFAFSEYCYQAFASFMALDLEDKNTGNKMQ